MNPLHSFAASFVVTLLAGTLAGADDPKTPTPDPKVQALIKTVENPDKSLTERKDAIVALANFGPKAEPAISAIKALLHSKAAYETRNGIMTNAYTTLAAIGKPAVPAILEGLKLPQPHPQLASHALKQMLKAQVDLKDAAPDLLAFLTKNAKARTYGYPDALNVYIAIHPDVKEAVPFLTDLARRGADLLTTQKTGGGFASNEERVEAQHALGMGVIAVRGLGEYGGAAKDAVPVITTYLRMGRDGVRIERAGVSPIDAITALGKIGKDAEPALPLLRECLDDRFLGTAASKAIEAIKAGTTPKAKDK